MSGDNNEGDEEESHADGFSDAVTLAPGLGHRVVSEIGLHSGSDNKGSSILGGMLGVRLFGEIPTSQSQSLLRV